MDEIIAAYVFASHHMRCTDERAKNPIKQSAHGLHAFHVKMALRLSIHSNECIFFVRTLLARKKGIHF